MKDWKSAIDAYDYQFLESGKKNYANLGHKRMGHESSKLKIHGPFNDYFI